jgi:hypothetical protein
MRWKLFSDGRGNLFYKDFDNNMEMIQAYFDRKYISASACAKLVKKELYSSIDMCEGAVRHAIEKA